MQKKYKFIISIILVTASSFGAVAQNKTHKDVVLDGKPAKLNVKTGEVKLVELKTINGKQVEVIEQPNSVINSNLLTNSYKTNKSDSTKVTYTNRPDTLANYYKNKKHLVTTDEVLSSQDVFITTNSENIDTAKTNGGMKLSDAELLKIKEKATAMVYEVLEPTTYNDNTSNFHEVHKGETLYALSKRYKTTLGDLKKANNLETTLIRIGQVLRIKNFDSYNFEPTSGDWTVSKGDTLYNIAKRNNTTVASLKSLNGLESNLIKIGQILHLK